LIYSLGSQALPNIQEHNWSESQVNTWVKVITEFIDPEWKWINRRTP
jgi:hypothetical protein